MRRLLGVAAAPGVAMGPAHLFGWRIEVHERRVTEIEIPSELARFDQALAESDAQLARIQAQIAEAEGDGHQDYQILEAHRLMLKDAHLVEQAKRLIKEESSAAEWAVRTSLDRIRAVFDRIEDPYFRERGSDIDAVGERLLRNLLELLDPAQREYPPGAVVYGHDLSPGDVTQLGRKGMGGFFTEGGGKTSHSAVVSRALGLPLVVGVHDIGVNLRAGLNVVVDGTRGEVILDPDAATLRHYAERATRARARTAYLNTLRAEPSDTVCGTHIHLAANVELLEEVPAAVNNGAASIGLFRTEFLYIERPDLPSEQEQYDHAMSAMRMLGEREATFRTLDLGGDKLAPSVRIPAGVNPALGMRSVRFSLWQRAVFKDQLRALYRAGAKGRMRILFPLISGVGELREVKAICAEVCEGLQRDGIEHNPNIPLGVMIETPSAALISDMLARECDFLTIGTNDLIQYSLAADRQDEHVAYLYQPLHPAIIRSIRMVVDAARAVNKPVAMCGDMAGDPYLTAILLGIGFRDLSMSPQQIPLLKSIVRGVRLAEAEALVRSIEKLPTAKEVEEVVFTLMKHQFPDLADPDNGATVS